MNTIYVFIRVIKQLLRDKRTMVLIFMIPFVIMTIFYFLLKDGLDAPLKVGAAFQTESSFSNAFFKALDGNSKITLKNIPYGQKEGALIKEGLDALVVFDSSFTEALAGKGDPKYQLEIEGTKPMIEDSVKTLVLAASSKAFLEVSPLGKKLSLVNSIDAQTTYTYPTQGFRFIDLISPAFVAFFMYFVSFILTCVSFLRERSSGTLERIESTTLRSSSLILGYLFAFMMLTAIQGALLLAFMSFVLGIKTSVSILYAILPVIFTVAIGVSMGIFFSTLAENEFQVIQFIPIVIIPQILLCGTLFDVESMPVFFRYFAKFLPLTYTNNFLKDVLLKAQPISSSLLNMTVLVGFFVFFTGLSILSIRKRH